MRFGRVIATAALPLAMLAGPARSVDKTSESEAWAAAKRSYQEIIRFTTRLFDDKDTAASVKIRQVVERLHKEMGHPGPVLTNPKENAEKTDWSTEVQTSLLIALANVINVDEHGKLDDIQAELNGEKDENIRDLLMVGIGNVGTPKPDPRQAAVFPRLIALARTHNENTAGFPYEMLIWSLGRASRYPEFRDQVVPILVSILKRSHASPEDHVRSGDAIGEAAKDALCRWGWTVIRGSQGRPDVAARETVLAPKGN